ncbi:hypothetical protein H8D30_04260 [bacterium]|nr:hypothetical protein [bacterium]
MIPLLVGGVGLSLVHALLPNHWMPLSLLAKREGWSTAMLARASVLVGTAHVASSILLGLLVGGLGIGLSGFSEGLLHALSGTVLVLLGIWVWRSGGHTHLGGGHSETHSHTHEPPKDGVSGKMLWGLALSMFLSPCVELEAYYLPASTLGWKGISLLSLTYFFVTVPAIVALALMGRKLQKLFAKKLHWLEHNEGKVTGILLILLGIFTFFAD